jgi:hypothetical protein
MPTVAQHHIVTAETIVLDTLQDSDDAYRSATEYVAALPQPLAGHAATLQSTFHHKLGLLPGLTGPREVQEKDYLRKQLVGIALQIGFLVGDLKRDWRN